MTWSDTGYLDLHPRGVFMKVYNPDGTVRTAETAVDTTRAAQVPDMIATRPDEFVVVWTVHTGGEPGNEVVGHRFSFDDERLGTEFQVNTYTSGNQECPNSSPQGGEGFVVTWESHGQDGSARGIFAQRFDTEGAKLGSEFQVNAYTTAAQLGPQVTAMADNSFVVAWSSEGQDGDAAGVFGRHFASDGVPHGSEFQIDTYTTDDQGGSQRGLDLVAYDQGRRVAAFWRDLSGGDGGFGGIQGQLFCVETADKSCGDVTCRTALNSAATTLDVTASDALAALQAAIGLAPCALCVCDADSSGGVSAVDALAILRSATGEVGLPHCPPC